MHGDRETTCTLGPYSPKLGDFHVGENVKICCTNGVLAGIVKSS